MTRTRLAALLVVGAAVVAAAGYGERVSATDTQRAGIDGVRAAVGDRVLHPSAFRVARDFSCLLYRSGPNAYALELCFDRAGYIVEAVDRRSARPRFWTLRYDTGAATARVDPAALGAVFARIARTTPVPYADKSHPWTTPAPPVGYDDLGPLVIVGAHPRR